MSELILDNIKIQKRKEINLEIYNSKRILNSIPGWAATNSEKNKKCKLRKKISNLENELLLLDNLVKEEKEITKEEKISILNQELKNCNDKPIYNTNNEDDGEIMNADTLRLMRYQEQGRKSRMAINNEKIFIINDIKYTLDNNVISIIHPVTNTKIRRSLVNNKTFYKGEWRKDITLNLLIEWYESSSNDILDKI